MRTRGAWPEGFRVAKSEWRWRQGGDRVGRGCVVPPHFFPLYSFQEVGGLVGFVNAGLPRKPFIVGPKGLLSIIGQRWL